MKKLAKNDFKNSILDGMFANIYGTLTGGIFLMGFALYLGMNEFEIGVLASIPFVVTVFQLPASNFMVKYGGKKRIAYQGATVARVV